MLNDLEKLNGELLELDSQINSIENIRCVIAIIADKFLLMTDKESSDMAGTMVFIEISLADEIDKLRDMREKCVETLTTLQSRV